MADEPIPLADLMARAREAIERQEQLWRDTASAWTIRELARRLDEATRWIPVDERLPDRDGTCLVAGKTGDATMYDLAKFRDGAFRSPYNWATHWRPLPEPPEGGG